MPQTETATPRADVLENGTEELLRRFRESVKAGGDWTAALLQTIGEWTLAEESVDGREYRYLVAGEAFDWRLLAERIVLTVYDCLPPVERDRFLFQGETPRAVGEEELRAAFGAVKHSAAANFWYGVRAEEAILLAAEREVRKSRYGMGKTDDSKLDDLAHRRIYGKPRRELLETYAASRGLPVPESMTIAELNEFTYWLFKYRIEHSDKARVASDTKKGLLMLQELASSRRNGATPV